MAARVHFEAAAGGGGGSGTVTNVSALTIGTAGTNLSSTVVNSTTTPVITLNVPTASAVNRGALSSADWSTFNGKQALLVSGTNIKTVNGNSLLGSGNLVISGGGTPSGVAGSVQFSDGTNFASDNANFFWDDTNKRLGIGTNAPSALLSIQNSINGTLLARFKDNISAATYLDIKTDPTLTDYTALYFGTDRRIMSKQGGSLFLTCSNNVTFVDGLQSKMVITPSEVQIGSISGARLGIKGSGTTSATTALLVQNSAGTEVLKVTDDSVTNARGSLNVLHPSVAARSLKLGWGSIFATDSGSELTLGAVFSVPSAPQILLAGNTRSSGANTMQLQASLGVSIAASLINPSAQLHIKGSGTTSATNALLVQNSAGTALLTIRDDGVATFGSAILANSFTGNLRTDFINTSNNAYTVLQANPANGNGKFYESVSIGTSSDPVASAKLELVSTTKGFLPPRMTTVQRNAIAAPATGLMVYDTDANKLYLFTTLWEQITSL
jgi:hypothetical protein